MRSTAQQWLQLWVDESRFSVDTVSVEFCLYVDYAIIIYNILFIYFLQATCGRT